MTGIDYINTVIGPLFDEAAARLADSPWAGKPPVRQLTDAEAEDFTNRLICWANQ